MIKKWWVIALVVVLALSLTSCGKKNNRNLQNFGFEQCTGTFGDYDAYVIPDTGRPGIYQLVLIPISVNSGDVARIAVVNQSGPTFKEMVTQIALYNGTEIFGGYLTEQELGSYNILAIAPWEANTSFLDTQSPVSTVCALPIPNSLLSNNTQK